MVDDPKDTLRLFLMQDILPVGMAIIKRARKGGTSKVTEPFTSSEDPFQVLRKEGETSAKTVREQLDKVSPGLGNPIVSVKVEVERDDPQGELNSADREELMECLESEQSTKLDKEQISKIEEAISLKKT